MTNQLSTKFNKILKSSKINEYFRIFVILILLFSSFVINPKFAKAYSCEAGTCTLTEGTYNYDVLTVSGGANLVIAGGSTINITGTLTVTGSSTITIQGKYTTDSNGVGSTINAATVTINTGSKISVDGQGYAGGSNTSNGSGTGKGNIYGSGGGGAGYGGAGGRGDEGGSGGSTYGSVSAPIDLGSDGGGGGTANSNGGAGGGAVALNISGTLTLNGTGLITARCEYL